MRFDLITVIKEDEERCFHLAVAFGLPPLIWVVYRSLCERATFADSRAVNALLVDRLNRRLLLNIIRVCIPLSRSFFVFCIKQRLNSIFGMKYNVRRKEIVLKTLSWPFSFLNNKEMLLLLVLESCEEKNIFPFLFISIAYRNFYINYWWCYSQSHIATVCAR